MPDVQTLRAHFPSLESGFAYLENAGGSQVPASVADAVRAHMVTNYVQLGAGYPQADAATAMVDEAHQFMEEMVNAAGVGRVVIGPTTTSLTTLLANAYAEILRPGDEVIIAETNHEANAGPWARLEHSGAVVKTWPIDPVTFRCEPATLAPLLTDRTRIVALPHVSNLVGQIEDVADVVRLAHAAGARVCCDGVAYAPHRAIDVAALGVDWYVFSTYKVYGPHAAALYGSHAAFAELKGPNHFFIPRDAVPYKWELGGVSHEGCAGLLGLRPYLAAVAGHDAYRGRATIEAAFAAMTALEAAPHQRLIEYLRSKPEVSFVGPGEARPDTVPTVSFLHARLASPVISAHVNARGIGIRHGNMYAMRMCQALGIDPDAGVVRISLVHYNTVEEIDRLIAILDELM